jgi:hypothetical protein
MNINDKVINTIDDFANLVATKLDISNNDLIKIINSKGLTIEQKKIDPFVMNQINNLLNADNNINNFEKNISSLEVKNNFNLLKQNLGKLQILILLKKLEKSKNCDEIINSLIEALTDKIGHVNKIIDNKLIQDGGSNTSNFKYYNKYQKYKIKYLLLKNNL